MSKILAKSSGGLRGEVSVSGSKNSALPILAACILSGGKNTLYNVPDLSDISIMLELLNGIGVKSERGADCVYVDSSAVTSFTAPYELAKRLRGSFLLAGAILAREGRASIALPGGCPIGARPIDLHLKGFAALGAEITNNHGYIDLSAKKLCGTKIYLDFPSVGATENIIMAAVLAEGTTIIENAAAEPEICDLADFLEKQGAKISGAGSDTVIIDGVKALSPTEHKIIPDRIEAGTFMCAFAATRGRGRVKSINYDHIKPVAAKLSEMGVEICGKDDMLEINADRDLTTADIKTLPFPGFPTDMQAPFAVLLSTVRGTGVIVETVFENRFLHIGELNRMGANIRIDGRTSVIEGVPFLTGAGVNAFDLRGGAALVLAGITARGETEIQGCEHIRRGYEGFTEKLSSLGADICFSDE